jgi:hypothetical protein
MIRNVFEQRPRKVRERTHATHPNSCHLLNHHPAEGATSRQKIEIPLHSIVEGPAPEKEKTMTPVQAASDLRQLSREARTLREGVRSLIDSGGFESASDARNLRFSQFAFDDAVVLFERLANLIKSD